MIPRSTPVEGWSDVAVVQAPRSRVQATGAWRQERDQALTSSGWPKNHRGLPNQRVRDRSNQAGDWVNEGYQTHNAGLDEFVRPALREG